MFSRNYVLYAQVGAFYALLSLDSLFWVVFFFFFFNENQSDNPGKHTVDDKILDKVIETGKGQKVKAK